MPKKALVVRFRNAAVFTNRRGSSDKVFAGRALVDRDKAPRMDVPEDTLDTRHISNMLHVLMGERPVPSLRKTAMTRDEAIYRAARQALVRVSELSRDETKTVRKAVKDAWNTATLWYQLNGGAVKVKGGLLYHDRLMRFLGAELYSEFLQVLTHLTGSSNPRAEYTAQAGIELMNARSADPKVRIFAARCRTEGRTALANLIERDGNVASITFHQGTGSRLNILVVNKGVEKVRRISGTVFVPVESDAMLARLANGTGVATLLEGGFAFLAGVEDWADDLVHGTVPVVESEIKHVRD